MPPKLGQIRRGIAPAQTEIMVSRCTGDAVMLPMPLYWDSPPWHHWSVLLAQCMCECVASRGILVSTLQSELGLTGDPASEQSGTEDEKKSENNVVPRRRMLPYRNERYGLSDADLDLADVVDIQLTPPRDASGRIAYSAEQIGRWESTSEDQPLSGGGWVPAMTLPPDVPANNQLAAKVNQIRTLCPEAAVVISATPEWIDGYLGDLIAAKPDALLIRLGQLRMPGIGLARFLLQLERRVQAIGHLPIWLTPPRSLNAGSVSVSDSIKLIALGASSIAIDSWLDEVVEELDQIVPTSPNDTEQRAKLMITVEEVLQRLLDPQIDLFTGLYSSLVHDRPSELLGTFDPEIADSLGLPCIGQFS